MITFTEGRLFVKTFFLFKDKEKPLTLERFSKR